MQNMNNIPQEVSLKNSPMRACTPSGQIERLQTSPAPQRAHEKGSQCGSDGGWAWVVAWRTMFSARARRLSECMVSEGGEIWVDGDSSMPPCGHKGFSPRSRRPAILYNTVTRSIPDTLHASSTPRFNLYAITTLILCSAQTSPGSQRSNTFHFPTDKRSESAAAAPSASWQLLDQNSVEISISSWEGRKFLSIGPIFLTILHSLACRRLKRSEGHKYLVIQWPCYYSVII